MNKRNLDTMSEAIALSSPSGSMSKHARRMANERLRQALFGDGLDYPKCNQPSKKEILLRQAHQLRELALHGMNVKAYTKEANRLEVEAKKFS